MKTHIYTGGTFDILHMGHINFFKRIKHLFPDSKLTVSLNTDEFIEKYKGKKPVFSYEEREKQIQMSECVDEIVKNIGDGDSKVAIMKTFENPQEKNCIVVIGQDWLAKDYCKQMGFDNNWLTINNISLMYVPYTIGISTTLIKERLK